MRSASVRTAEGRCFIARERLQYFPQAVLFAKGLAVYLLQEESGFRFAPIACRCRGHLDADFFAHSQVTSVTILLTTRPQTSFLIIVSSVYVWTPCARAPDQFVHSIWNPSASNHFASTYA